MFSNLDANPRKRKNKITTSKSPEQSEIEYLKLEINAVRTQVIELESTKTDLERKVKIMEAVIKSHEDRQASKAYQSLFSAHPSVPSQPNREQGHTCSYCSQPPPSLQRASYCCCPKNTPDPNNRTIENLVTAVDKLQCEMIDASNQFDLLTKSISNLESSKGATEPASQSALKHNVMPSSEAPTEGDDVAPHLDDSIVSFDEFVSTVDNPIHESSSLNYQVPTNQLK